MPADKRAANAHRGADHLITLIPASRDLLTQATERGEPLGRTVRALAELLDAYGTTELTAAIAEAMARGVPHPNAVRLALERRRQARDELPPVAVTLIDEVG